MRTWSFGICANLYNYRGSIVINGPNKRRLTNAGSLVTLVVGYVSWSRSNVESRSLSCWLYRWTGLKPRERFKHSLVGRSVCTSPLPLSWTPTPLFLLASSRLTRMVPTKGTLTLKSDFNTRHSVFMIRWLRTWSFGICANLYNYCGSIFINETNKKRLTNTRSLVNLIVGYVDRFRPNVESRSRSCWS